MATMHPISSKLAEWYEEHRRELPWRNTSNPYYIWLSEVILQQTRVDQGMAYYLRFIERFKTVEDLAAAREEDVLHLWQGLGYYSRARNLHAAAKSIVENYRGIFPAEYKAIISLKGVGDYTAAAIASIAFGLPHAAVDGNVNRVLSRIFAVPEPVDQPKGKQLITEIAATLLDIGNPGRHNQALMELGALICLPRNPNCSNCPMHMFCNALKEKKQTIFPIKSIKTKIRERYFTYFIYLNNTGETLLQKRTEHDIWQGLFEFPMIESSTVQEHKALQMVQPSIQTEVSRVFIHLLSHQKLHIQFVIQETDELPMDKWPFALKWKAFELNKIAFPRAITRFLERLNMADKLHFHPN
jgi:A/G-specific adenine glycosylase